MSLTLTLVRHGESTDNLKALWAGHRDAPLTTHGMNQARRLGKSFEDLYITKIYASDLKRAHWTALQIATQNKGLLAVLEEEQQGSSHESGSGSSGSGKMPETTTSSTLASEGMNDLEGESGEEIAETEPGPSSLQSTDRSYASAATGSAYEDDYSSSSSAAASSPVRAGTESAASSASATALLPKTVTTTPFLREQFFGLAEGQNWKTGYATSSNSFHNRNYCFEQGESLEDVGNRAEEIMKRCVLPWLVRAAKTGRDEHVVLVAHGIMISELLFALSRLQDPRAVYERRSGHTNTGWTRLKLTLPSNFTKSDSLAEPVIPHLTASDLPPHYNSSSSSSSSEAPISSLPKISLRQTHTNITTHLNGLKRTKGGVGSEGFDSRQKSLRQFFSGGGSGEEGAAVTTPRVPDPPVDLTNDDDDDGDAGMEDGSMMKTNGEAQKRGIRLKSPASPSPKKGRLT